MAFKNLNPGGKVKQNFKKSHEIYFFIELSVHHYEQYVYSSLVDTLETSNADYKSLTIPIEKKKVFISYFYFCLLIILLVCTISLRKVLLYFL